MRYKRRIAGGAATASLVMMVALHSMGRSALPSSAQSEVVPAYHHSAPREGLPPILPGTQFSGDSARAYEDAGKIKGILYQLPCYCYCDRHMKHESLLDCFKTDHASYCLICIKEALYAYEETKAGKSAAQIRQEIIEGKWRGVKLVSQGK
jgi:hypothetical protein